MTFLSNFSAPTLLIALASAILFLGAIHLGDLAGYDDALYSAEAKNIVQSGTWMTLQIRGGPALEHPPLFVWTQAALLSIFGISDYVAKLPSAVAAVGTVLLVYWLARRLLQDALTASAAMFIMLVTPYFIKYASRAMTDVPTTFLFICTMCCWPLAERDPRWYWGAGALTALTLMTRGLIGFALPAIFVLHLFSKGKNIPWAYVLSGFAIALLPLAAWYAQLILRFPEFFTEHNGWLQREVYGSLSPAWRRYTGLPEYLFMIFKSYWPWLPFLIAGTAIIIRERRRDLWPLLFWVGVVLLLCAAARSRVLRYMLPAYPAFSILASIGIRRAIPERFLEKALDWMAPAAVVAAMAIVLFFPAQPHASEILPIVHAQAGHSQRDEAVAFYDEGKPRWDEANQLEWYGELVPRMIVDQGELENELRKQPGITVILDRQTYNHYAGLVPHEVLAESGHLIYFRPR